MLKEAIEVVRILPVPSAAMKAIEFNQKELLMYFSPGDGRPADFTRRRLPSW